MGRRIRSKVVCPACGLLYEKFRSDQVPDFRTAYGIVLEASREAHANGDYSRNAYVGTVLGYMRLAKQDAWKEHLYWCYQEPEFKAAVLDAEDEVPF